MNELKRILTDKGISIQSAQSFQENLDWLKGYLSDHDLRYDQSTYLGEAISISELFHRAISDKTLVDEEMLTTSFVRQAISLYYFIRVVKLLAKIDPPDWMLNMFRECVNAPMPFTHHYKKSQKRNIFWEFVCLCICADCFKDVRRDEPDLIVSWNNINWGIACKTLYSDKPNQQIKRLADGAKQIERSSCDYGIVFADVSNLIDHETYLHRESNPNKIFNSFQNPEELGSIFETELKNIASQLDIKNRLTRSGTGEVYMKTRAVFLFAQTVAIVYNFFSPYAMSQDLYFREIYGPERDFLRTLDTSSHGLFGELVHESSGSLLVKTSKNRGYYK